MKLTKINKFFLLAATVGLLTAPSGAAADEPVTVVLNHGCPAQLNGQYDYDSVKEVGYVVAPNVVVTREFGTCNFPDDGVINGKNVDNEAAIEYLIDWNTGVKVFITEKALPVSCAPPEWTREYLKWAMHEIGEDGGSTRDIIAKLGIGKFGDELLARP